MKVTMKDLENLSWAYNLWEDRILDSPIQDDKEEQRQNQKDIKSMKKTFKKINDVLLEKLKQQKGVLK
tara:strand:- start:2227 stop:2430 length:204 start_codon:yes stop_codon:yes gene_type:complete